MAVEREPQMRPECIGCKKKGMDAINCDILPRVDERLLDQLQCTEEHESREVKGTSGGKFISNPSRFNRKQDRKRLPSRDRRTGKQGGGWRRKREHGE